MDPRSLRQIKAQAMEARSEKGDCSPRTRLSRKEQDSGDMQKDQKSPLLMA